MSTELGSCRASQPSRSRSRVRSTVGLPTAGWELRYRRAVVLADLNVIGVTLGVGLWVTDGSLDLGLRVPAARAVLGGLVLVGALAIGRVWEPRILGQGVEEFRRIGLAVFGATVALGAVALATGIWHMRPWVFGVLPGTGVGLLVNRYGLRKVLHFQRRQGRCLMPVLAAGSLEEVAHLIARTRRDRYKGWRVEAVCAPGGVGLDDSGEIAGVPVVGDLDQVADLVRHSGYRVVAVTQDPYWNRRRLRDLAWELEDSPVELVVAPVLMEITGPRLHVTPVDGLALLRASRPALSGIGFLVKSVADRLLALLVLIVLLPLLLVIAVAIRVEDRGPVLFRQTRVGRNGERFNMIKFRSMVPDAEQRRGELVEVNEASGPLFKLRRDPRVTHVGAVLRRYSLDELPQLCNVVLGTMALVGPRPPLPEEVERFEPDARRRLLVKPGLTGLWQVNGRSDLAWEEAVRLDLRYVENWSLSLDLVILWKTAGAVLRGNGAY